MRAFFRLLVFAVLVFLCGALSIESCFATEPNNIQGLISAIKSDCLNDQQFEQLTQFIQPSASEDKWRETPWIPSIQDGRKMSAAKNKPIFLWAMNGDPLGCV